MCQSHSRCSYPRPPHAWLIWIVFLLHYSSNMRTLCGMNGKVMSGDLIAFPKLNSLWILSRKPRREIFTVRRVTEFDVPSSPSDEVSLRVTHIWEAVRPGRSGTGSMAIVEVEGTSGQTPPLSCVGSNFLLSNHDLLRCVPVHKKGEGMGLYGLLNHFSSFSLKSLFSSVWPAYISTPDFLLDKPVFVINRHLKNYVPKWGS